MLLQKEQIQYINSIPHAGKVVLFGTDTAGKVWYTIKQDGFEDSYLNTPAHERTGWEDWQELEFPNEAEDDASVIEKETKELTLQNNTSQFILRSRYRTQAESAVAPVQLVSGMEHLYVFRQSKQNTLLCDRYVLDGIANKLVRKLQVRFKRSRQRFKASDKMQQTASGLKNVDSLDYRDANGISFYEPTTELTLINNLHQGWFSVIQLPTVEHAKNRWNIFAYNSQTQKIDLYSLRVSAEGLFAVHDYNIFEPKSEDDPTLIPDNIPGIIKRTLDLNVQVGNGISATKYYVQVARETDAGQQLMRDATKVMLGIVTTNNTVATISFTALGDGTLSKIQETSNPQILRNNIREVLLPLNSLDNIKGIGIAEPPPEGTITALKRTITDGIPNVQITSAEASFLKNGDELAIAGTTGYDGYYTITKIDETTFEIDAPWVENNNPSTEKLGTWQVVPPEQQAVIFDGLITGYEITPEGKLRVTAENHGLENGDEVQIFDTVSYDGAYPITKVDDQNFIINNLRWQIGEAVSLKLQSQKRRGVVFNGAGDYIDCGNINFAQNDYTIETWLKTSTTVVSDIFAATGTAHGILLEIDSNGNLRYLHRQPMGNQGGVDIYSPNTINDGQWHHVAAVKQGGNTYLYIDGSQIATGSTATNFTQSLDVVIGKLSKITSIRHYQGYLSELRIWKVARTEVEIKNSMYLRLTGKELNLIGYWRLGGIAVDEDNQRTVIDFSVNRNNGIVYGNTYVGEITLNRYLGDGITPIVKFTNEDLVAVSQRATYIEEFEFKVNPIVNVNNADGNSNQIFQLSYWGQTSRQAKYQISIVSQQNDFEDLGNGWYRATSRFTIPDDVALLRSFEIADICGNWDTLEIRKHHLRLISNIITEASFNDSVSLSSLGLQDPQGYQAIKQLASQETRQGYLIQEKLQLEAQLNALLSQGLDRDKKIQELQTAISSQQTLVNSLQNDANYWSAEKQRADQQITLYEDTNYNDYREWSNKWTKKLDIGYYSNLGNVYAASSDDTLDIHDDIDSLKVPSGLKITLYKDIWYNGDSWILTGNNPDLGSWRNQTSSLKIETINGNTDKNYIAQQLAQKQNALTQAQKTLSDLQAELSLLIGTDQSSLIESIKARLEIINSEIQAIRDSFFSLNQGVLDAITDITNNPLTLPQLSEDSQGLVTQGGILNFVNSVSRIHALETCEGNVQLSYFDKQGNMRNTLYDATSDSLNTTFEEWIPDGLRSCLNFNTESSLVSLNSPIYIKDNFTLEAWFAYPFTEQLHWRVLASSEDDQQQIVVHESKQLGLRLNGSFFDCGYDLIQLSVGWHHLTITSKYEAQTTSFYIDGEKVGTTEAKITSNIRTLGNITNLDSVSAAPTQTNTALQFDGVNDYVVLPSASMPVGNEITVSFWTRSGFSRAQSSTIFSAINANNYRVFNIHLPWGDGNIYFDCGCNLSGGNVYDRIYKTVQSSDYIGQWVHWAFTKNATTGEMKIYRNGILWHSGTNYKRPIPASTKIHLGQQTLVTGEFYNGTVAELSIWNKARTQAEIQADMNKTLTGNELGLVGYWPLRDGSAQDYSASKRNGTIYGGPQTVPFEQVQIGQVLATQPNTGLKFNGTGDYIEIQNYKGVTGTNPRTVEAWIKTTSVNQTFVSWGDNNPSAKWTFRVHDYDKLRVEVNGGYIIGSTPVSDGKWHHVACTWQNDGSPNVTDVKFYVDGQLEVISSQASCTINTGASRNIFIGNDFFNRYFNGEIAEVRIWNKARTQAEIQADMNKPLTGKESGLMGYWPLQDGSADDYSANGYNGTMYGIPQTVSFEPVKLVILSNPNACHFGKLAEVRFWDIGLNDQEIAVNSKILLSGNEPGLIAYYPMTEATGDQVRDYSGNSRHGKMQRASWWGCTAPIGNLGHTVMKFDGKNDYVATDIPLLNNRSVFTLEGWVKALSLGNTSVSLFGQNDVIEFGFNNQKQLMVWTPQGGTVTADNLYPTNEWHHIAVVGNGKNIILYLDGTAIKIGGVATSNYGTSSYPFQIAAGVWSGGNTNPFLGQMAEVRIWNKARTPEEIKATMHQRLTGKETGLLGYWPLSKIQPEGATVQTPDLTGNHPGTVHEALIVKDNTLPIGADIVVSSEYGTFEINLITKQRSAMMRRMFASPSAEGVKLLTHKRIETLELLWIGNAQFAPTLLGYIEGAPPVPSENMNIDGDYQYNGATSVQLTTTEDVEYSWNRSQDAGLGGSFDVFIGVDSQSFGGVGVATQIESTRQGFKGVLDLSYQWLNESNVSSSSSLAMTDRLELRGAPEVTPQFSHYGNRFIPKNVGYALVVSSLADVFITRLSRSKKMVGYEVRPVEDIPPDVNTITFLINPAYVMNGSLDGLVGSSAANDKFYGHVPEMRSQYGSLYPASYFRLVEAYNLKQQIEKADKERLSYFENFNSNLVDEGSLNRQVGEESLLQGISLNEEAESIDISSEGLTDQEKQAQLDQKQEDAAAKLKDLQKQGDQRKQQIKSQVNDTEQRAHALESFAGWQKNMENILIRSGKRNIVNTYVWDADGGLRMEEQSFANTTEHTVGGSFTLSGGMGYEGDITAFKPAVALTALVTANLTQTMTKTQASSKGMELNVDLSGIEMLGITDENDIPFQPGEKVDRFRMMSFYLEGSTDNYLDFFNYVVDPEWLASNDEEARALRQVQSGRPNKTWRVLHRVTYVERPSLMGFGRDMRSLAEIASFSQARMAWLIPANATVLDEVKNVRSRVEYLEAENAKLQAKLDQIIDLLNN